MNEEMNLLDNPPCGNCGGPHQFDTSIPSYLWNEVVRASGKSDYLCLSCIVSVFASAGKSFTATLWGDNLDGIQIAVTVYPVKNRG